MKLPLVLLELAGSGLAGAEVPDRMEAYSMEVCGATVTIDLHPSMTQPATFSNKVLETKIAKSGSVFNFITCSYDYGRAWHLERDGSVMVNAMVMRRLDAQEARGLSYLDADQLIASMLKAGSSFQYEKMAKQDRVWIKRTKLEDRPPGRGRTVELNWLVPLRKDILMIVRVDLHDYATPASAKDAKWYQNAEALQQRIFESLRVDFTSGPTK